MSAPQPTKTIQTAWTPRETCWVIKDNKPIEATVLKVEIGYLEKTEAELLDRRDLPLIPIPPADPVQRINIVRLKETDARAGERYNQNVCYETREDCWNAIVAPEFKVERLPYTAPTVGTQSEIPSHDPLADITVSEEFKEFDARGKENA